jgi:hypothetical protein
MYLCGRVTVTSRAQLNPCAAFFVTGDTEKLVYTLAGPPVRLPVDF